MRVSMQSTWAKYTQCPRGESNPVYVRSDVLTTATMLTAITVRDAVKFGR